MRPNVLVVVLDAVRRDALEPYGAALGSTPAIAQLASTGTAMPDVYATGCWTVPSHASFFTGLMPRAAGLSRAGSVTAARPVVEAHRDRLLPEVFRRAGYWTAAASANLWVSKLSGFSTGFDDFVHVEGNRHGRIQGEGTGARLRWLAEGALARTDDGAGRLECAVEGWIPRAQTDERPFLWFVNVMEAHSPYLPPRRYAGVSTRERLRAAEDARRYYTLAAIWRVCSGVTQVPEGVLDRMQRLYAASVRYMDDWLGRVVERLDAAGLLDDTLVLLLSDHGENLGEAGLIAHALSLDNRLIHVPFIAMGPGAADAEINSLAGLPGVLAAAAGIDEHPWGDGPALGVGVAQLDPPLDHDDEQAAAKLDAACLGQAAFDLFTTPQSCSVAGSLKLLRRGEREELYDLAADPLETAPVRPEAMAARAAEIEALRRALDQPAMAAGASAPPGSSAASQPSEAELRDLEERMRLLGYL